jgi:hypothetical protein
MTELARLDAVPARRGVAVAVIAGAGGVLMLAGADIAGGVGLLMGLAGAGVIALAPLVWQATARHVVLTEEGVFTHSGVCLARIAEIEAVITAPFAFKPSNGFSLRLRAPQPRLWAPGLYWRWGRRVGIGGVPAGRAARDMADRLAALVAAHQVFDQTT